jgi:hypothetical protein
MPHAMNYSNKLLANISVNSLYQNPALSSKMHTQQFQFSEWGIKKWHRLPNQSIRICKLSSEQIGTDPRTNRSPFLGHIQVSSSSEVSTFLNKAKHNQLQKKRRQKTGTTKDSLKN